MNHDLPKKEVAIESERQLDIARKEALLAARDELLQTDRNPALGLLFCGDRMRCCDEGIVMKSGREVIGLASIAPQGEEASGQPTIVGLYVKKEFRQRGFGDEILKRAIERCQERGFKNIRLDVMSGHAKKIIDRLPEDVLLQLDVHDLGTVMENIDR